MRTKVIWVLVVLALLAGACSGDDGGDADDPDAPGSPDDPDVVAPGRADRTAGPLGVKLSEGEAAGPRPVEQVAVVDGEPLDTQAVDAVLARLPEWIEDPADRVAFNRPAESLPPPVVGDTLDQPFPTGGDDLPPAVESGPLEVLRHQPDGDVGLAPFVSLTFNQPMIALGTVEQTDAADVPVEISPEVPGSWQWIGTRTLRFEHDREIFDRLPMATTYTVTVPAGTTSANGGTLAGDYTFSFETPPPVVRWLTPGGESLDLDTVFVAFFDQRIDPDAMLGVTTLEVDQQRVDLRLATDNELAGDEDLTREIERATPGTWMAFRATESLPADAQLEFRIGPNRPSLEGPNTNGLVFEASGRTYAPLRVVDQSCTAARPCQPDRSATIQFNNQLDGGSITADDIVIEPALPGAIISIEWNRIRVRGPFVGDSTYDVTIPAGLTDEFGQTLGEDETVTLHIEAARPFLGSEGRFVVTLDPLSGSQTLPVQMRGHEEVRVRAYAVDPDDWRTARSFWERRWEQESIGAPNLTEIHNEVVATGAPEGERFEARIDLDPILGGEPGMALVVVETVQPYPERSDEYWDNRPVVNWVQSTTLGPDFIIDNEDGYAWVTDLATAEPLEGVEVELRGASGTATTDEQGLARIPLPTTYTEGPLIARHDGQVAVAEAGGSAWTRDNQAIWYVVDDRGIYRPGETASVKGWVRTLDRAGDATLEPWPAGESITWVAHDAFGNEIGRGEDSLTELGGFDFTVDIPLGANLGFGWIELRRPATPNRNGSQHQFQIQEFRRPEFEVTARAETPGPYFVDEPATVAVDANYFSGGPLPDAPVEWWVATRPASYSPPGWDGFTFGQWIPWWGPFPDYGFGRGFDADVAFDPFFDDPANSEFYAGTTDAGGTHYLQMDFDGDGDGLPTTVSATASVTDVNRQTWSSTTDVLVHPGALTVGVRATRSFVRKGDGLDIEVIVTDIDGNAAEGRAAELVAERVANQWVEGEWTEVVLEDETCSVASEDQPVVCPFALANGGRWRVTATVVDDVGRESRTELATWVSGGDALPTRRLELEEVTIIPDQEEYLPGDTAEIFVASPFGPATGLLTVSRNGIVSVETFEMTEADTILEVPILDEHVPNLGINVELVGVADRTAIDGTVLPDIPPRPAFARGWIELRVPPVSRTLDVVIEPALDAVEPGASTDLTVTVTDPSGAAVEGAEVLVVAVDEAVLALSGYELLDPLEIFYRRVDAENGLQRARSSILLADPEELIELAAQLEEEIQAQLERTTATPGDDDSGGDDMADDSAENAALDADGFASGRDRADGDAPIEVRENFDALALWDPEVTTDANGSATLALDLPDSLTRYRLMAVAVDGVDRFGSGEANLTARLPLQVRPSAPRFLNFGDDLELPIVVQNLTDDDMDVDVVLQTANLDIEGSQGRSVTVPANNRVEVRFPVSTESAGTARFRAAAVSADHADAATVSLPVYTPATAEAFATYGVVDDGTVLQPVLAPTGVIDEFGGLEVTTSSTAVQALTDAVLYLAEYPYRSADGHASRLLAIAALRDVLEAFDAEGLPTPAEFDAAVADDIAGLAALQNFDGAWGTWRRDNETSPYRTVHVMHALYEADANGYSVPDEVLEQGRWAIQNIERFIPNDWSPRSRDHVIAYSLFVRALDGDRDPGKAVAIWDRNGLDLGMDALAWIWPVVGDDAIQAEIATHMNNAVAETAGAATFTTGYSDDANLLLHSDRRTDGIILDALITMDPDSDLIPKVVAGLIGNQRKGRWNNAQENAFILVALNRYFDTFEAVTPDFVARVWLGDLYAAEHEFEGRSVDSQRTLVPMADVIAGGDTDLVLDKDGAGRLYYRLGLRYAPDDFDLDPLDRGFVVERTYEAVDDEGDVWQDGDGTWHVKAGAEVRVSLTMVNDFRRTNMALIDPLPAGLEPNNPALAVTVEAPSGDEAALTWWNWTWYDHQNLRDDRAEAFAAYLWAGTHEYSYVARATTPGTFVVPPTRAEEIYAPEVFGRSDSDILVVEAP